MLIEGWSPARQPGRTSQVLHGSANGTAKNSKLPAPRPRGRGVAPPWSSCIRGSRISNLGQKDQWDRSVSCQMIALLFRKSPTQHPWPSALRGPGRSPFPNEPALPPVRVVSSSVFCSCFVLGLIATDNASQSLIDTYVRRRIDHARWWNRLKAWVLWQQ
jgi:hypothetical protein